jgi:hypothetical protein
MDKSRFGDEGSYPAVDSVLLSPRGNRLCSLEKLCHVRLGAIFSARNCNVARAILVHLFLLTLLTISACSTAQPKPNIEHMLATAQTASDHEAVANYYESEAADAKAKYEEHKDTAAQYVHNAKLGSLARHCGSLAQDFKGAEQDASVLAEQHRQIAREISAGEEPLTPAAPAISEKLEP